MDVSRPPDRRCASEISRNNKSAWMREASSISLRSTTRNRRINTTILIFRNARLHRAVSIHTSLLIQTHGTAENKLIEPERTGKSGGDVRRNRGQPSRFHLEVLTCGTINIVQEMMKMLLERIAGSPVTAFRHLFHPYLLHSGDINIRLQRFEVQLS